MSAMKIGDQVVHIFSGWTGIVTGIAEDDDGGMGQGPLVTCRLIRPKPSHGQWRPITVTAAELKPRDGGNVQILIVLELDPRLLDEYAKEIEADIIADGRQPDDDTVLELLEGWAEELREAAENVGYGGRLEATAKSRVVRP